jgi:hypothetical protein
MTFPGLDHAAVGAHERRDTVVREVASVVVLVETELEATDIIMLMTQDDKKSSGRSHVGPYAGCGPMSCRFVTTGVVSVIWRSWSLRGDGNNVTAP